MSASDDPIGLEEETDPPGPPPRPDLASPYPLLTASMHAVVETLHAHGVEPIHHTFGRPIPQITLELIEDGLGYQLPHELVALYRTINGMRIAWGEPEGLHGEVHLTDFDLLFGTWLDTLWTEDPAYPPEHRDLLWRLRPVSRPAAGPWVCVELQEHIESSRLWAFEPSTKRAAYLELALPDLPYCALGAYGSLGWPLCFAPSYDWDANPWGLPTPPDWIAQLEHAGLEVDRSFYWPAG